jgi:hypothetical protein
MPSGLFHAIHSMIVFGRPHDHIHRKKDAAARRIPGLRHRRIRHGWYRAFGRQWDLSNPFPDIVARRTERFGDLRGPERAEEFQVAIAHDHLDRVWDYEDRTPGERSAVRKYWEGFFVWLLLNPTFLRNWAGVDVLTGRIERLIDGKAVWEEAPEIRDDHEQLCKRAYFLLRVDKNLRQRVEESGGLCIRFGAV